MPLDASTLTSLAWLLPIFPLAAFFLIWLFTNESRRLSHSLAILAATASFVAAQLIFWTGALRLIDYAEHPLEMRVPWLPIGPDPAEWITTGVLIDPLAAIALFFVSITVLCIFVYSVGYHNFGRPRDPQDVPGLPPQSGGVDPLYARFFAFIALFAAGMYTLVVSDNLLFLFIGWEIMGLCSYLLIGFWYGKPSAYRAAVKAFLTTRVGDVLMLLGIAYLYQATGTLSYREIFEAGRLAELAGAASLIGGISVAQLIFLLLFAGTVGKSAQWPLHIWLPDAMEGPTPVSAMIHAATMVSAGVYMVIRMFPLLGGTAEGIAPFFVPMALIGAFTALMASTMALAQSDIKRVLAFSTIAQLGYMIAALGVGAYVAAAFHLVTHAFFKALLFLGSGSVIHGMEHGHHHAEHAGHGAHGAHGAHEPGHAPAHGALHAAGPQPAPGDKRAEPFDPNNMFNMGGLLRRMPVTGWTFIAGGLALAGFPLVTAGFWSKDEILTGALERGLGGDPGALWAWIVLILLSLSAFLTAFYTMRQIALTFLGAPRTEAARHAPESVWTMTAPLVVLAIFAIGFGWVGIPENFLGLNLPAGTNWFHHFIAEPIEHGGLFDLNLEPHGAEGELEGEPAEGAPAEGEPTRAPGEPAPAQAVEAPAPFNPVPLLISLVAGLGGLAAGYTVYGRRPLVAGAADPLAGMPLWEFFQNRWYWDELYGWLFIRPVVWFSEEIVPKLIDQRIIDGVLHGFGPIWSQVSEAYRSFDRLVVNGFGDLVGNSARWLGAALRPMQDGRVQHYILMAIVITLAFLTLFVGFLA